MRSETNFWPELENKQRVRGIEPPCAAWEAAVLPLNYTREEIFDFRFAIADCNRNKRNRIFRPNEFIVRCPQHIFSMSQVPTPLRQSRLHQAMPKITATKSRRRNWCIPRRNCHYPVWFQGIRLLQETRRLLRWLAGLVQRPDYSRMD